MPFDSSGLDETGMHLLNAANYLEDHGWCQNTLINARGNVCLITAISINPNVDRSARRLLYYLVNRKGAADIQLWNDYPGRTKEEAIQALREAAFYKEKVDACV